MMNTYVNAGIDYHIQLSGSAKEFSEDSFVTSLFTHLQKEFASMINIFHNTSRCTLRPNQ
jgi:hypothetical protein